MKLCPNCTAGYHDSHVACPTHGGVLSEIRELKPGMIVHKTYRIVRKLGRGGMGIVYLADQTYMQEQRALKFLSPELCEDEAFTNRFRQEVRALRQVRHRNVVDCGDLEPAEDDSLFFAMEFVDGPDLRDFMHRAEGPLDVKLALAIARGIAEGLGAAHALGMVHRDIKPENILMARVGDSWVPKIADFGIVASKESSYTRTRTGGTLLTMAYAAPEQWRGTRAADLDGRTDLYALGGILFEMLTGRTVFDAEGYEGWAEQHKNAVPIPPSNFRPEQADWSRLDDLVLRLLAKGRDQRPATVTEVIQTLDAVKLVPNRQMRMTALEAPIRSTAQPLERPAKMARRTPPWIWATAAALLVALSFAAGRLLVPRAPVAAIDSSSQARPNESPAPQIESQSPKPRNPPVATPKQAPLAATPQPSASKQPPVPTAAQPSSPQIQTPTPQQLASQARALYSQGLYREAANLYERSCAGGVGYACDQLGEMYLFGNGVSADSTRAAALYSRACDEGDAAGCGDLGYSYQHGQGVTADLAKAKGLFGRSCSMGSQQGCGWLRDVQ